MLNVLFFLFLLITFKASANEACYSFYPNKLKVNVNHDSPAIQIYRSRGFVLKLIKLSEMQQGSKEFNIASNYLNSQYLKALDRSESIKEKIKNSNKTLWNQMHLLLVFDSKNLGKPVAGAAYISSKSPAEKLGFEEEFKIDYLKILDKDFSPATEVGRLSVDSSYSEKRKVLDVILDSIYHIHVASADYKQVFIYSSKKLLQLYSYKGFNFEEIPQLSNPDLIDDNDTIAIFKDHFRE